MPIFSLGITTTTQKNWLSYKTLRSKVIFGAHLNMISEKKRKKYTENNKKTNTEDEQKQNQNFGNN